MTDDGRLADLEACIRELRNALYYYGAVNGWDEVEHANAFENSKDVVPLNEEERQAFA